MDQDIDDALTAAAARLGTSRSALVRDAVRAALDPAVIASTDAADELVGCLDVQPDTDVDAVIYGLDA